MDALHLSSVLLSFVVLACGLEDSRHRTYSDVRNVIGGAAGSEDGISYTARFNQPSGITKASSGEIWVAEAGTHAIRMLTPAGRRRVGVRQYTDLNPRSQSCAEIRQRDPRVQDGQNIIYYQGNLSQPIAVYCSHMDSEPKDYIEVNPATNYAGYNCDGSSTTGPDIKTTFWKVRLNTTSFRIILDDFTFSNSTGNCTLLVAGVPMTKEYASTNPDTCRDHGGLCSHRLRYGFAGSCSGGGKVNGLGSVDFTGTNLAVHKNTTWRSVGFLPGTLLKDETNNVSWTGNSTVPTFYSTRVVTNPVTNHYYNNITWYGHSKWITVSAGGACGWAHAFDSEYDKYHATKTHQCPVDGVCTGLGVTRALDDNEGLLLQYVVDPGAVVPDIEYDDFNVSTFAGTKNSFGVADGTGTSARFKSPTGVFYDELGRHSGVYLYVADYGNHVVKRISAAGVTQVYVGQIMELNSTATTGPRLSIKLCEPYAVTVADVGSAAAGTLYISEYCNHIIRSVAPDGSTAIVAGSIRQPGQLDGTGSAARFRGPRGLAEHGGSLYVADSNNHVIRSIDLSTGTVTTIAGQFGVSGYSFGVGSNALFTYPMDLAYNAVTSELYVSETGRIRSIAFSASPWVPFLGVYLVAGPFTTATDSVQLGKVEGVNVESTFSRPRGMVLLNSVLYVVDFSTNTLRSIQDRPCPFKEYGICNMNASALLPSTPAPACNTTDWQILKLADSAGNTSVGQVNDACNTQLNTYCYINGNSDKACSLVPKACPTSTNSSCSGHGTCNQLTGICTCDASWGLLDCSNSSCPVSPFGDIDCNPPNGFCNKRIPECVCAPMKYGTTCEFSMCPSNCSGHGSCDPWSGGCTCIYPWGGDACDLWQWYVNPVAQVHSANEYDVFDFDLRWWNISRWEFHTLEVTANLTDQLANQGFGLTLMKERVGVDASKQYWVSQQYPPDHELHRSLAVCPLDLQDEDPRYVWKVGVKSMPNTPYTLQFNVTKTEIPLNEDFIVETYGFRYLHIERFVGHEANYSSMWLDIEVLDGTFENIRVSPTVCPIDEHETDHHLEPKDWTWTTIFDSWDYHVASGLNTTNRTYNSSYDGGGGTNRYRLELWDCSSRAGYYFVGVDARGGYLKAKMHATINHNDHRCETIVPPMREEIIVTFGEVVERTFPVVVGTIVLVFLLFMAVRYCVTQRAIINAHKKRLDQERFKNVTADDYFGEETGEDVYTTKKARKAVSAFQARKEREGRLAKEIVRAQLLADGYQDTAEDGAMY